MASREASRLPRWLTAAALAACAASFVGCGSSNAGFAPSGASGSGPTPPSLVAACEGGAGGSVEARCDCIESHVQRAVSQRDLNDIASGDPPVWYMRAALKCQ